jgi:hypothetical protein
MLKEPDCLIHNDTYRLALLRKAYKEYEAVKLQMAALGCMSILSVQHEIMRLDAEDKARKGIE